MEISAAPMAQEDKLKYFVGKKQDYYLKRWQKSDNPARFAGRNWAAFLVPFYWFAYRKMWNYFAYSFGLYLSLNALYVVTKSPLVIQVGYGLLLLVSALSGYYGNALYYREALKQIEEAEASGLVGMELQQALVARGGVKPWSAVWIAAASAAFGYILKSIMG